MKTSVISALVAAVLGFAAAGAHAQSVGDGTITFNGALTATTCTINGNNSSSKDFTVNLPTVSTSILTAKGDTAGTTGFNIALTACSPVTSTSTAAAFFQSGPTVDLSDGMLMVDAGGATNVKLQLLNQDMSAIKAGFSRDLQGSAATSIASGAATLYYNVQYYAEGATTAGAANSSVVYSIDYQ